MHQISTQGVAEAAPFSFGHPGPVGGGVGRVNMQALHNTTVKGTMMPALWIAHVTVTDEAAYKKYAAGATEAIAAHGGTFIARGGRYVQLEGKDRPRNVVARFPDLETAEACYHSDAYQAALAHARGASERELLIVETSE